MTAPASPPPIPELLISSTLFTTPRPPKGWPYSSLPRKLIVEGLESKIRDAENQEGGNWVIATFFNSGAGLLTDPRFEAKVSEALGLLCNNVDNPPTIIMPDLPTGSRIDRFDGPKSILIGDMHRHFWDQLMYNQVFIVNEYVAFRVYGLDTNNAPQSLTTIYSHTRRYSNHGDRECFRFIRRIVQSSLMSNKNLVTHILTAYPNEDTSDRETKERLLDNFLDDVHVEEHYWMAGMATEIRGYRVIAKCPPHPTHEGRTPETGLPSYYNRFVDLVRATEFKAGPVPFHQKFDFKCKICKTDDHPTFHCPWPMLDGYVGPTTTTKYGRQAFRDETKTKERDEAIPSSSSTAPSTKWSKVGGNTHKKGPKTKRRN